MTGRIIFWGIEDRPSSQMRGRQMAEAMAKKGFDATFLCGNRALRDVRDATIIAVKNGVPVRARLRNRVIFDCIDLHAFRLAHALPGVAGVIAPNHTVRRMLLRLVPKHVSVRVIYHHADPRILPNRAGEEALKIVYVGEPHNSAHIRGQIPELAVLDFRTARWLDDLRDYNAHFSARLDRTKSVVKLANAAASEAVFVTAREPGCVELLGDDYPYYLRNHRRLGVVREDVADAARSIGTERWHAARARLEAVRERLSLDSVCDEYAAYVAHVRAS